MSPSVPVVPRRVEDLRPAAGDEAIERLRDAASALAGARVLQVSSTAYGGGVAELLHTQVALLNDLGIHADWQVIEGTPEFFAVTKAVHNALQGADLAWTPEMERIYLERCHANAAALPDGYDFVIVHDPQPAAVLSMLEDEGRRSGKWAWRCHIDLSAPSPSAWEFFAGHVARYDGAVFTMPDFVRPGLQGPMTFTIPPSIDPVSDKNLTLADDVVRQVLARYGVDPTRPIATQISRFDPWKDPTGVIDAYRLAHEELPDLQLLMVASMAADDPEGQYYFELTEAHRNGDADVHLLSNLDGVGNVEVNAFQRASDVIVQKSIREGFGLVVAEGLWKGRPVIGGNAGGIRLQIEEGVSGFLVDSVEVCAGRMVRLLLDPDERARMGASGRERVRQRFLTPRELEDYLRMLAAL